MSLAIRKMPLGLRLPLSRLAWIVPALLLLLGTATAAYGFWASLTSSSNAAAAADALSPGSQPAVAANGSAVSVTWAGGTTVNGRPATGYTVTRYLAATGGTGTAATGGCAGTVITLTCTEQNVPGGIWYYTVTPAIALWTGSESPRSTGISTDATAPVATVQSVSPTPNAAGWINTSPVTLTITADDGAAGSGVASITYAVDGGAKQTVSGASALVPASGDGTHTVSYFATDNAGNAGTAQNQTVRIDTQAPAPPVFTTVPSYVYSGNVAGVPLKGTAEANAEVTLTAADAGAAHSTPPVTATADGSGNWSVALDLRSLDQGTVTFSAMATDAAGNTGAAKTSTSTKDTVAPAAAQAVKVPIYVNAATAPSVNISGSAEVGATVAVSATSPGSVQPVTGTATASDGTWSMVLNLGSLKDGAVTYTVTVQDAAGNTGSATTATDTKDTQAPALVLAAPRYVNSLTAPNLQVSGTAEAGVVVTLTVSGTGRPPVIGQATATLGTWSVTGLDVTGFSDGSLTFSAATSDAAGNSAAVTAPGPNTKDVAVPAVFSITGTDGNKGGLDRGDLLTITFTDSMDPSKFCPGWTGASLAGTVTLSNAPAPTFDTISFSTSGCTGLSLGTISLGADYVGATAATFSGNGNNASTLTWDSATKVLTIKFGALASGSIASPAPGFPSYDPASGLTDLAGNPLSTSRYTSGNKTAF
ncbi:hypothetical protein QF038_000831 [Pseudarthrobacter sp. W1I19]|uniref:OmpL47-type beta-barrel domain-containing protein n=1 Tax=Pseudarthrobacter sp. W1I19 TaxID=3042288 RepID=UPI0027830C08|nr:Ig-like domain-containing protein [Pseudarthrobacter sp. W1I19]MDQ0922323.1 hypothetical protein [Pseudarthrobacter sp. W1I19]